MFVLAILLGALVLYSQRQRVADQGPPITPPPVGPEPLPIVSPPPASDEGVSSDLQPPGGPMFADGARVKTSDGRQGPVVSSRWDKYAKVYYYRIGGLTNEYQETQLQMYTSPKIVSCGEVTEWPLNNAGGPMVRAVNPQNQPVLISESMAGQIARDNLSGWLFCGSVLPEPSGTDLSRLVQLQAQKEYLLSKEALIKAAGITEAELALADAEIPLSWILAARHIGWSVSQGSLREWIRARPGLVLPVGRELEQVSRSLSDQATSLERQQIAIANRYDQSFQALLTLAAKRGITA